MSGQMSNGEIEGVLASVRRLLRDDAVAGATGGMADADGGEESVSPGMGAHASAEAGSGSVRRPRKLVLNPDTMVRSDGAGGGFRPSERPTDPLVLTDPAPADGTVTDPDLADDPALAAWSSEPLLLSDPVVLPGPVGAASGLAQLGAEWRRAPAGADPASVPEDVPVPEAVWHPPSPAAASAAAPEFRKTRRPPTLEERIAELEAALARDEATWEPDGGDPAPAAEGLSTSAGPMTRDAGVPATEAGSPAGLRPRLGPAEVRAWIEAESLRAFGSLPDDIADAVAAAGSDVPRAAMRATDAEGEDDADGDGAAEGHAGATDPVAPRGPERRADVPDAEGPGAAGQRADGLDVASVATAVSAHGPVALSETDPAPRAQARPAPAAPVSGISQDLASSAAEGPAPHPAPAAVPSDLGLDPVLEAAVRELVAQAIRDELRGPLGEELTRSIRRLVRRELARLNLPRG